jgi:hypothetical protein
VESLLIPALALDIGAQPLMVIDEGGKDEPFGALRLVGSREVFVVYDSAKRKSDMCQQGKFGSS